MMKKNTGKKRQTWYTQLTEIGGGETTGGEGYMRGLYGICFFLLSFHFVSNEKIHVVLKNSNREMFSLRKSLVFFFRFSHAIYIYKMKNKNMKCKY